MGPVTGLARLPWRILLRVNMGNFSPVDQDEFRKHNQNGRKYTYNVRDCHSFVYSCNFTNKANSHISKVEIQTRPKLCHFGGYVAKAKLFLSKKCRPGYRAEAFIWENVFCGYQYLGRKNRDLGQPSLSYEEIEIFTKKRVVEVRSRKPSQPGWRGLYKEAIRVCQWENQLNQRAQITDFD